MREAAGITKYKTGAGLLKTDPCFYGKFNINLLRFCRYLRGKRKNKLRKQRVYAMINNCVDKVV